jgi:hypothetical protein
MGLRQLSECGFTLSLTLNFACICCEYVSLKHILTDFFFFNVDVVQFGKTHCYDIVSMCLLKELEFSDKCFSSSIPET